MTIRRAALLASMMLLVVGAAFGRVTPAWGQDGRNAAGLGATELTVREAIKLAERQTDGRAIAVETQPEFNASRIAIDVLRGQDIKTVVVDMKSGEVVGVRNARQDGSDSGGHE